MACHRDVVARFHPVDEGVHLHAVDLCHVALFHIEGRDLAYGEDHELVGLHEPPDAVEYLGALRLGPADLRPRQPHALFDVPHHRLFELAAVILQGLAVGYLARPPPKDLEYPVRVLEIGLSFLDDAPERLENAALGVDGLGHSAVHRQAAEVAAPGNSDALEVAVQRSPEALAGLGNRNRGARIRSGDRAEQERGVLHRPGHRPLNRGRTPAYAAWPDGHAARRRAKAYYVAEAGRVAERAACVAAIGDGDHPTCEGHGGASTAASACLGRVVGIQRLAEHLVVGLGPRAELGRVRLADRNCARLFQPLDDKRVPIGHEVLEQGRAVGRADPFGEHQVLVGDG